MVVVNSKDIGQPTMEGVELTILMPCLNEAETLATCIGKARDYLERSGVVGEILIADNGSTDGSQQIAVATGARVVDVPVRGYGAALTAGISAAYGRYVIMGDADDSYDFSRLQPFVDALRGGAELVMGNRFKGGIAAGAMPLLHRYLGNPVLSTLGRMLFSVPCGDFHCGLRGFSRDRINALHLNTTGMEFASEMVVCAALAKLRIVEVSTTLSPDGRNRAPHLNTWRDGWRHLRFLLIYSPRWLYLYPGIGLILLGALVSLTLLPGPLQVSANVSVDIHTFLAHLIHRIAGIQKRAWHNRLESLRDWVSTPFSSPGQNLPCPPPMTIRFCRSPCQVCARKKSPRRSMAARSAPTEASSFWLAPTNAWA